MSMDQVKAFLSTENKPSTLISGGVTQTLDRFYNLESVSNVGMLHNFVPDGSTMRGVRKGISALPTDGLAHTIAGKVLEYDRDKYMQSDYGLFSPYQQHALEVYAMQQKYADHTATHAHSTRSRSNGQLTVSRNPNCSLAGTGRESLGVSDFPTVKEAFCDPERSVVLASFALSRYMDECRERQNPDHRIISNNGDSGVQDSMVGLINAFWPMYGGPQQSMIRCTEATRECAKSKVNDTEWALADRQLMNMVLNDPDCQEVAFTRGAYRGNFECEQV
jgi:hypothetical protein